MTDEQQGDEPGVEDASIHIKPDTPPQTAPDESAPDASIQKFPAGLGGETMLDMSKPDTPPQPTSEVTRIAASDDNLLDDDTLDLRPGEIVLGRRIEENPDPNAEKTYIGFGASGVIYRARHDYLGRPEALKFLRKNSASAEELEQFKSEARVIASLQGKNILKVYDFSEWNGNLFMAMELLEGGSAKSRAESQFGFPSSSGLLSKITKLLKKEKTVVIQQAEYIVSKSDIEYFVNTTIQVAEQLEIAHDNGILHRDIKPGNIMYRNKEQDDAVLVDYGLAALIRAEHTMPAGTPEFMSAEQANADRLDARTDVFGLGATLYTLLTGKSVHNFNSLDIMAKLAVIINGATTDIRQLNKKVDRNLAAIVHKAVEKQPWERYQSVRELYNDLKRWKDGKSVKARPVTSSILPTGRRLRKRGLLWLSAAALTGIVAGSLYKAKEPVRLRDARIENYISDIKSSVAAADAAREEANKSYEALKQKSLIEMSHGSVNIAELENYQKLIGKVLDSYNKALKVAEDWKKDDVSAEKKSEEKRRELEILVKEFEKKNDYALQKTGAYEKIAESMKSYEDKNFPLTEKALASSLDRLYELDTQKELVKVQEEHSMYQKQRTMQGVRDIAKRVREYRRLCRACFMDEIEVFSGSEEEVAPETGIEWKKTMKSIEKILETPELESPDGAILRKIQLDVKTYKDLMEQAVADAREAFYGEQSILKNKDVKRAIDMKRNRVAEDKYIADVSEKYKNGKIDEEEFRVRMRLPLPSEHEQFMKELENEFKKGVMSKSLYDKLQLEK